MRSGRENSSGRTCVFAVIAGLMTLVLASGAQAAFVVYDDFNGANGTPVDASKWGTTFGNSPVQNNGTVTLNADHGIRSLSDYPVGTTLRFVVTSIGGSGAYLFGTNSLPPSNGAAGDAMFVRNDTGGAFYVDGASQGASGGSTAPATFDFVFGADKLDILRDGVSIGTLDPRPAAFGDNQRFEIATYSGGSLVVDQVLYQTVPEPTSLGLLGLATAGILSRRRR